MLASHLFLLYARLLVLKAILQQRTCQGIASLSQSLLLEAMRLFVCAMPFAQSSSSRLDVVFHVLGMKHLWFTVQNSVHTRVCTIPRNSPCYFQKRSLILKETFQKIDCKKTSKKHGLFTGCFGIPEKK
jgi:hypothetical protein